MVDEPIKCEECGHDVFVETTTTRRFVVGKFNIDDESHSKPWITLLEPPDAKPRQDSSITRLTCDRCGVCVYERSTDDVVRAVRCA